MKLNIRELIVFWIVFFLGSWAGTFISNYMGWTGAEGLYGWIALLIPATVVYFIWKRYATRFV